MIYEFSGFYRLAALSISDIRLQQFDIDFRGWECTELFRP